MGQAIGIIILVIICGLLATGFFCEFINKPEARIVYYVIGGIIFLAFLISMCSGE
jgi:hypothetical protein